MMNDEKNILYLNIINQRLNRLIEVFELTKTTNLENAVTMVKPPIFWKDKTTFLIQVKKWNSNKIRNILNKTYKIELEIKSNPIINKNLLLKKLIVDICVMANSL
jgi:DNA polymerase III delta subunit